MALQDNHLREILDALEREPDVSQRSLSARVGIAVGLTNLLLKRLARMGWIRVVRTRPNRVRYILTPSGIAQRARLTREYLRRSIRFYAEARDRVQQSLGTLAAQIPAGDNGPRVVFWGSGDVAEVGYVCVQRTSLRLVGVVDDDRAGADFFGLSVSSSQSLSPSSIDGVPYDRIVVMSFGEGNSARASLEQAGVPPERVFWV